MVTSEAKAKYDYNLTNTELKLYYDPNIADKTINVYPVGSR